MKKIIAGKSALHLRLVRRSARRLGAILRWRRVGALQNVPVFFANSFPKSGTHLLTQVLEGFPAIGPAVISGLPAIVTYQGDTGRERAVEQILADLKRLAPGDIAYGHLHAFPEVVRYFARPDLAAYFILRDPRDVVVSHVHYITEMAPWHIHHRYYFEELHTFDERLRTSIIGLPGTEIPFPDIAARFKPFLGWLEVPTVLTLRFEEFLADRQAALGRVLDHAVRYGFPLQVPRETALDILSASIDPQRSPTFRSGKAGGWRQVFNDENKRLFKEIAGDLLIYLGYEQDLNW